MSRPLRLVLSAAVLGSVVLAAPPARTHPMGSNSINHFAGIEIGPDFVRVKYLLDFAEMPAFRELERIDPNMDDRVERSERETYLEEKTREVLSHIDFEINGEIVPFEPAWTHLTFPPGEGGFSTVRISWELHAVLQANEMLARNFLLWSDRNHAEAAGWKEIRFSGADGIGIEKTSLRWNPDSAELTDYPDEFLDRPPNDTKAWCHFGAGLVPLLAKDEAPAPPTDAAGGPLTTILPGGSRRHVVAALLAILALAALALVRFRRRRRASNDGGRAPE